MGQRHPILSGSGDTKDNRRFLDALERALPEREFAPVAAWASTFFGYQQTWLFDTWRFSLLVKCRQIGGSHAYAGTAVLWGLLGEDTSIVSVGERESAEVLSKVARHAMALVRLGSEWARPVSNSSTRLTLASGARIFALPSTSGGRGQSGNMLLDEAAYFEHPEEVWDGASATVLHGYRMRVCSTPNGVGNLFHQLVRDHERIGYRLHLTTLEQARADGIKVSEEECWKMARGDSRLYDQLFNCSFLDSELQYIPTEAIDACCVTDTYTYEGDFFAGLDIGRTADRTTLVVLRKVRSDLRVVSWIATCKRTDWDALEALVAWCFAAFNPRRLCVDSTGLGAFPAERLQKRHGKQRVEPVIFTLQTKEELATGLYSAFAEQTIRMPKTTAAIRTPDGMTKGERRDPEPKSAETLRQDLCAIRREVTAAGNVRYDAPRTDEGHADSAWALALALHACGNAPGKRHEILPTTVKPRGVFELG